MELRERIEGLVLRAAGYGLIGVERLTTGVAFNPLAARHREDPYPLYRALRERDPVHRSRAADGWVFSRYEDVAALLADARLSADERHQRRWPAIRRRMARRGIPDPYEEGTVSMLRSDPPVHTRLRRLVSRAFTPRAVDRLRPRIEAIVKERLEGVSGEGFDLVDALAGPLPAMVIAELLGVPPEEHVRFRHLSDEVARTLGVPSTEDVLRSHRAGRALRALFEREAEARRREPRDDLLSALVAAEEAGDRLTMNELVTTCGLLLVAGHETTTKLIANGVIALLRSPEQLALLREEPERIPAAVEELLRLVGPVQLTSRMVREEGAYRGVHVRPGRQLVLLLASANRDEAVFEAPDRLDVTRSEVRHLAFGQGIHFCLGARLARLEAACALEGLLARFPKLALAEECIAWGDNIILRGPTRLPLRAE